MTSSLIESRFERKAQTALVTSRTKWIGGTLYPSTGQCTPQHRFGMLRDLDGPLQPLFSEAGAFMTGPVVAVDGGHLVSSL